MAIYTVYADKPKPATFAALQHKYADNYKLSDNLLAFRSPNPSNGKDILLSLSVPQDEKSAVLITQITGDYWGYHIKPFWDWLEAAFRSDIA